MSWQPCRIRLLLILFLVAATLLIGTAGWGDLYNETDGQYSGAAKQMALGGSWLVPENNGVPRLVKPPLLYWAMAGAMKIFGINEFSARLPGALSFLGLVVVTFLIGERLGGVWRGFVAGAILLTTLGTFTLGRIIMPEPTLAVLIAAALYCVLRGCEEGNGRLWYLAFWFCAALASFVKGWHGMLYPLLIVLVAAAVSGNQRAVFRGLLRWEGLVIFVLVNAPWYIFIEECYPGWLYNFTFVEVMGHVSGSSAPATNYSSVPRWQFILLHGAWLFPWSFVAGGVLVLRWREVKEALGKLVRQRSFPVLLVVFWAVIIFCSVLLAGQRQDYYAMAMWPAFALGIAWLIEKSSLRIPALFLSLLFAAGLLLALVFPIPKSAGHTASVAERATAWSTLANLDPEVWRNLATTGMFALAGGTLFCVLAFFSRERRAAFCALVLAAMCLDLGAVSGVSLVAPFFSLSRVAPTIAATPDAQVIYDGDVDTGSSLLFYSNRPLLLLDQNPNEDFIVRQFGIGRNLYVTTDDLVTLWKSERPMLFITESRRLSEWQILLGEGVSPIQICGTQIVLKNHP